MRARHERGKEGLEGGEKAVGAKLSRNHSLHERGPCKYAEPCLHAQLGSMGSTDCVHLWQSALSRREPLVVSFLVFDRQARVKNRPKQRMLLPSTACGFCGVL